MEDTTAQPITQNQPAATVAETPVAPPAHAETKSAWMPKKTLILIAILTFITLSLLALALYIQAPKNNQPKKTVVVSHAHTTLVISQPIASNSAYQSDIAISTGSNKITAVQMELTYDPSLITVTDIIPGTFFSSPVELLKKIVPADGRITYVLGINLGQKPISGNGTVAVVKFTPIADQTKPANINFLQKTEVTAENELQSVLLKSTGVLFSVTPTPTVAK